MEFTVAEATFDETDSCRVVPEAAEIVCDAADCCGEEAATVPLTLLCGMPECFKTYELSEGLSLDVNWMLLLCGRVELLKGIRDGERLSDEVG